MELFCLRDICLKSNPCPDSRTRPKRTLYFPLQLHEQTTVPLLIHYIALRYKCIVLRYICSVNDNSCASGQRCQPMCAQVDRARDSKPARDVARTVLAEPFALDAERMTTFDRPKSWLHQIIPTLLPFMVVANGFYMQLYRITIHLRMVRQ